MDNIKIVSFDLEGTLVSLNFSQAVWHEGIPSLYASQNGISFTEAKDIVLKEYQVMGDQKKEWYDIKHWFNHFRLGDYRNVLEQHRDQLYQFPDVLPILSALGRKYRLIIATGTAREFLPYLLDGLDGYFVKVFSSVSDYGQLKIPQFYNYVCQEMGVEPHEMVHVGDSWRFDFMAAKEAGIKAFHLNRKQESGNGDSLQSLTELETRL
ncbi:HAD family hydrolase [Chloroflexota bacterium]